MKCLVFLFCFSGSVFFGFTQNINYQEIDRTALAIPAAQTKSTADIAAYINSHFDTDNEKVRAIFTWEIR